VADSSESKASHWALKVSKSKEKMKEGLQTLQPWAWTLKRIGGVVESEGGGLEPDP
jgi:hypothetical protein